MTLTSEMIKAKAAELGIDCIAIGNIERFRNAPALMSPLSIQQGEAIPAVCHAVSICGERR